MCKIPLLPREDGNAYGHVTRRLKLPGMVLLVSWLSPGLFMVSSWSSLVTGAASYWEMGGGGLGAGRSVRGCDCLLGGRSGYGCLALSTLE